MRSNSMVVFETEFEESYPHGAYGITCTAIWNDHAVTAARRDVKVWRQKDDECSVPAAPDVDSNAPPAKRPKTEVSCKATNKKNWKVIRTIITPEWDDGAFRSIGGPQSMCVFARGGGGKDDLLVIGDGEGNINLFCWLDDDDDWDDPQIQEIPYSGPDKLKECIDDFNPNPRMYITHKNEEKHVTAIAQLDDQSFVASHLDGTIFQFTLYKNKSCNKKSIPELFARTDWAPESPHKNWGIRSMVKISDSSLASGAEDNAIKVWHIDKTHKRNGYLSNCEWTCLHTLNPNEGFVTHLALFGSDRLLSIHDLHLECGKGDQNILYVWDLKQRKEEKHVDATQYRAFGGDEKGWARKVDGLFVMNDQVLTETGKVWDTNSWEQKSLEKTKGFFVPSNCSISGDLVVSSGGGISIHRIVKPKDD